MSSHVPFIDSDAHVIEPVDMFEKYLEPKFRSPLPVAWSEYSGEPLAFRFKLVIPGTGGAEYSMPFGRDPLNDERRARFRQRLVTQALEESARLPADVKVGNLHVRTYLAPVCGNAMNRRSAGDKLWASHQVAPATGIARAQ